MKTIALADYTIYIDDIWETWNAFLKERTYSKVVVLVDENTKEHCLPIWEAHTAIEEYNLVLIKAGEQYKTLETCKYIWGFLMDTGVNRSALMVNLGGGVIGDMGGFCASTFKRGIDFVQFPSTLLAQVDASIGGKLGIDFHAVKNSVGVFQNPQAVFIEPTFLNTLPKRQVRSG
ncbi:MAG: iron-containing alcohol dehydrogenase, partial [Bacteroidota bacterium]